MGSRGGRGEGCGIDLRGTLSSYDGAVDLVSLLLLLLCFTLAGMHVHPDNPPRVSLEMISFRLPSSLNHCPIRFYRLDNCTTSLKL